MASSNSIDTSTKRNRLAPRPEPYWHKIITGRHIGFRRTESGGAWIAPPHTGPQERLRGAGRRWHAHL